MEYRSLQGGRDKVLETLKLVLGLSKVSGKLSGASKVQESKSRKEKSLLSIEKMRGKCGGLTSHTFVERHNNN